MVTEKREDALGRGRGGLIEGEAIDDLAKSRTYLHLIPPTKDEPFWKIISLAIPLEKCVGSLRRSGNRRVLRERLVGLQLL